jgi:myo-inositol-1(or 4)-monophosphatase
MIKAALGAILAGSKIAELASGTQVVNHKGNLRDIVTQADIDISELLEKQLGNTGLPVISEENFGLAKGTPDAFWVVDPIDGTVNFSHGLQHFAVSIGLVKNGAFKLGFVCAPALDELYFNLNADNALLNGRPFKHTHGPLEDALVAASFSAKASQPCYNVFQQVNESTRGCLRTGSAALNICWAATGKLQAAYGFNAKLWDVAGALAIAKAAGCKVAIRYQPNALTLDYCVGSQDVVNHITSLAKQNGLWD